MGYIKKLLGILCFCMLFGLIVNTLQAEETTKRPATVLLVTSTKLAPAWQDWVTLKTRLGLSTKLITVDQIQKQYEGKDVQEQIRACVLDHIEKQGTKYVVLGGDSEPDSKGHVPHRSMYAPLFEMQGRRFPGNMIEPGDAHIPVDLYYITPKDKDWDADGDGHHGEWGEDQESIAYAHPNGVSIGRIPLRTKADVIAYTKKITTYEMNYPKSEFAQRFMYTNTTRGSEAKVRKSWDAHLGKQWKDGKVYRFFHTSTPWDKEQAADYALNTKHFLKRVNENTASKMHIHGHGMPQFWVLEHATGNTRVNEKMLEKLTNKDAPIVLTTVSCFTGQFDTAGDPCIVESILRLDGKGAVLAIAPSRSGVPVFHNPRQDFPLMVRQGKLDGTTQTMTRFWVNGLSAKEDGSYRRAGEAFMLAKTQMEKDARQTANYHALQIELNLLGDPTLYLRPVDPVDARFEMKPALKTGPVKYEMETNPNATICLWKGDEIYQVIKADGEGKASVDLSIGNTGMMDVTVSGAHLNAKTWQKKID